MVKVKIKIGGLHCAGCALEIDDGLEALEGVRSSKTNYAKAEVEVEFDPNKVKQKQILEVLQKSGYTVVNA